MPRKQRDYKAEYQARKERGLKQGYSVAQATGHAKKGETPISVIKKLNNIPKAKPPKITRKHEIINRGNKTTKIVTTKSTTQVFRSLNTSLRSNSGKQARAYVRLWDKQKGRYVNLYYGKVSKNGPHGISVEELLDRIDNKLATGEAENIDEAIRDVFSGDGSGEADYVDSEDVPYDFSQVELYIRY